jgi:hypothetical protein
MAIAAGAGRWLVRALAAIAGPAERSVEFGLDERFDPVADPLAHARLDRVDPIVEKSGLRLAGRMRCICLADKVRHGVVSRGTGALQRPNPAVWVATPGDYATLSKVYHLSDGTLKVAPKTLRLAAEASEIEAIHPLRDGPWIFACGADDRGAHVHHRAGAPEPKIPRGIASCTTKPLLFNDIDRWVL